MMRVVHGVAVSLLSMSVFLRIVLGLAVHAAAVYCAWDLSGWGAAVLTLIFPVIGELYWIYVIWQMTGHFWSILAIGCALYVAVWVLYSVLAGIAASTAPSR